MGIPVGILGGMVAGMILQPGAVLQPAIAASTLILLLAVGAALVHGKKQNVTAKKALCVVMGIFMITLGISINMSLPSFR